MYALQQRRFRGKPRRTIVKSQVAVRAVGQQSVFYNKDVVAGAFLREQPLKRASVFVFPGVVNGLVCDEFQAMDGPWRIGEKFSLQERFRIDHPAFEQPCLASRGHGQPIFQRQGRRGAGEKMLPGALQPRFMQPQIAGLAVLYFDRFDEAGHKLYLGVPDILFAGRCKR